MQAYSACCCCSSLDGPWIWTIIEAFALYLHHAQLLWISLHVFNSEFIFDTFGDYITLSSGTLVFCILIEQTLAPKSESFIQYNSYRDYARDNSFILYDVFQFSGKAYIDTFIKRTACNRQEHWADELWRSDLWLQRD